MPREITKAEYTVLTQHKRLHDTARWFAMSMLEGPLAAVRTPVEIIPTSFSLAKRFLEQSENELARIQSEVRAKATSGPGAADPVPPGALKTAGDKKIWVGEPAISGDLSGVHPQPSVPKLDALREYAAENGGRLRWLSERLVASGPKAAHVSASETHEISDGLINLLDLIEGVNRG